MLCHPFAQVLSPSFSTSRVPFRTWVNTALHNFLSFASLNFLFLLYLLIHVLTKIYTSSFFFFFSVSYCFWILAIMDLHSVLSFVTLRKMLCCFCCISKSLFHQPFTQAHFASSISCVPSRRCRS